MVGISIVLSMAEQLKLQQLFFFKNLDLSSLRTLNGYLTIISPEVSPKLRWEQEFNRNRYMLFDMHQYKQNNNNN